MIRKPSNHLSSTSRRNFLRASAGTGLAFAAGVRPRRARAATEKILFQLDWIPFGRHAPYYAALENGFYGEKGMDVTIAQGRSTIQGIRSVTVCGSKQLVRGSLSAPRQVSHRS